MVRRFLLALALVATHTLAEDPRPEGESLDWPEDSPGGTSIMLARVPHTQSLKTALPARACSRKLPICVPGIDPSVVWHTLPCTVAPRMHNHAHPTR